MVARDLPVRPRLTAALAAFLSVAGPCGDVYAQGAGRLGILQAEERRASAPQDLLTLRAGARSADPQTARTAIRALGRLERPALVTDLLPGLRHRLPEVRAEAANAIAQASQGLRNAAVPATTLATAQQALAARLQVEADPVVRAAICESIARLPYRADADIARAETTLVDVLARGASRTDRLGVAKGLEALARLHGRAHALKPETLRTLADLSTVDADRTGSEALRDARVRRLALDALIHLSAVDTSIATRAAADPDAQVRRLAAVAAETVEGGEGILTRALSDPAPMVRAEALRALARRSGPAVCEPAVAALSDREIRVALAAIDQLAHCGADGGAMALLQHLLEEAPAAPTDRGWQRQAHALLALASADPDRARMALPALLSSPVRPLRTGAARAAAMLREYDTPGGFGHDGHEDAEDAAPAPRTATRFEAAELRRLASPRARFEIRGLGSFDVALFTVEAPATVLRFARLAASGAYNGLTFRAASNALVETGVPGVDGLAGPPERVRDEVGLWPHVRGALGLSAPGRDEGDGRIFINLVDNPQFDHTFTVFAQVLNGIDIVDRIVEGDVIERVEILP